MNSHDPKTAPHAAAERQRSLRLSFVRGIAWTGAAKWSAQLLTWISTIVVARFLSPEDYGLVQLALVFLGLVAMFNEFGIGAAVVTLRDLSREQLSHLNSLAVLLGAGSILLCWLAAVPLGKFYGEADLSLAVAVLSTSFVVTSLRNVPQSLLQKELRFKLLGFIEGTQALLQALGTAVLAILGYGYWSLIAGRLIGTFCWTGLVLAFRRQRFQKPQLAAVRPALNFSSHIFIAHLAWYAYSNSHFLLAGHLLGTSALGFYTLAWTLANIPTDKITALLVSVIPAYFSIWSEDLRELRKYFLKITEGIALVIFPFCWGTALVAKTFVPLVLGKHWVHSIEPLQILPLYVSCYALATVLPHVLRVTGETRFFMLCDVFIAVAIQGAFWLGLSHGIRGLSITWVLSYPLLSLPLFWRVFRKLSVSPAAYFGALAPALGSGVVMVGTVLLCQRALPTSASPALQLTLQILTGVISYALVLLLCFRTRLQSFLALLREIKRQPI